MENLLRLRASERALAEANAGLEEKVRERTAALRELARHLESSREDERRRLARELHDEMGQLLTALRMALDQTRKKSEQPELAPLLERMDGVLEEALHVTRHLVSELRPRVLDDLGLGEAASWYLGEWCDRGELDLDWAVEPPELTAGPEASTAVFRTMQEALTNAAKHSGARQLRVRLALDGGSVALEVEDDGEGFDPERVTAGFGLLGMRERAEAVGGALAVESRPGSGTRLRLIVPSPGEEALA